MLLDPSKQYWCDITSTLWHSIAVENIFGDYKVDEAQESRSKLSGKNSGSFSLESGNNPSLSVVVIYCLHLSPGQHGVLAGAKSSVPTT